MKRKIALCSFLLVPIVEASAPAAERVMHGGEPYAFTVAAKAEQVGDKCPPDGSYKASKLGAGGFSGRPMRVSGGRLTGVPDDWVQVRCESRAGKPLYKVFFRSKSGFNHSIDLDR